jgi:parallel beta-helix repeat protein
MPVSFLVVIAIAAASGGGIAKAAPACARYASTAGNDSSAGTATAPFRTAQKLASSLTAGETGCLLGGTYVENVVFRSGGTSETARKTLTTAPGSPRATINGIVELSDSGGDYVTLDNLRIDGNNVSQAVLVQLLGDYGRLTNSEVDCVGQKRIGVMIGFSRRATGVEVDHNRIHDCGISGQSFDHGIYDDFSDGALIHDNVVYDNAGFGLQLWTTALNGRIYNNTFDGNGKGNIVVGGDHSQSDTPSSNNDIYRNIFSNPGSGTNVVIFWGGYPSSSPGTGNSVHENGYWNGNLDPGSAYGARSGVIYSGNANADPRYADRGAKDFTLSAGSPLAGYGANAEAPAAPAPQNSGDTAGATSAAAPSSSDTAGASSPAAETTGTSTPKDDVATPPTAAAGAVSAGPDNAAGVEGIPGCQVITRLGFWASGRTPPTDWSRPYVEVLDCTGRWDR